MFKPTKNHRAKVLYLDYDGVLHHENCLWQPRRGVYLQAPPGFTLFQHAPLLDQLLEPYADVLIVLSTSWVLQYGVTGAAKRLPPRLSERVVGATYHSEMNEGRFLMTTRGQQVLDDLGRRKPAAWLALDDNNEGWTRSAKSHLVLTHPEHGISHPPVLDELTHKLALVFGNASGRTP